MLKRISFGFGALLALAPATCTRPSNETSVASQKQANWLKVDSAGLASAKELPPPKILPETYFAAGQLLEAQGQFTDAVGQYQRAVLLNHEYVAAYHRLGLLLGRLNRHRDATVALARAAELRPDEPVILNNLGFEHAMLGEWTAAETHLRRAVELSPRFDRARINLAMVLSQQDRFDDAFQEFRVVLPEPQACYNLGLMYCGARRYRDAGLAFHRALKLDPSLVAAQTQLAQLDATLQEKLDAQPPSSHDTDAVAIALTGGGSSVVADDNSRVFSSVDATVLPSDEAGPCNETNEVESDAGRPSSVEPSDGPAPIQDAAASVEVAMPSNNAARIETAAVGDEAASEVTSTDVFPFQFEEAAEGEFAEELTSEPCGDDSTSDLDGWVAEFMRTPHTVTLLQVDGADTAFAASLEAVETPVEDDIAGSVTNNGIEADARAMVAAESASIDMAPTLTTPVAPVVPTAGYGALIDVAYDDEVDAWFNADELAYTPASDAGANDASCSDLPYAVTASAADGFVRRSAPRGGQRITERHGRARRLARTAASSTFLSAAAVLGAEPLVEVAWDEIPISVDAGGESDCVDAELAAAADALDAWASANVTTTDYTVTPVASLDVAGESMTAEPMALTGLTKAPRPRHALPRRFPTNDPASPPWGRSAEATDARLEDPDAAEFAHEGGDVDEPCPEDVPPGPLMTDRAERTARIENPEPQP